MNKNVADRRTEYIKGLRALADALEQNPNLAVPYDGNTGAIMVMPHGDQRAELAEWARLMPGRKDKAASGQEDQYFTLEGSLHGLKLKVICDRPEVCERVVVGTREVEVEEPDPAALAAVPKVKRTQVVEDVEWRCSPLLSDETPAGAR